jgi:phycoerythrin-associated linker protein
MIEMCRREVATYLHHSHNHQWIFKQMIEITQFITQSIGQWRSQRSAHHLAFGHFEAVRSEIEIAALEPTDTAVVALCQQYGVDMGAIAAPFKMSWQGESDWDENEVVKGSTILVPVPDPQDAQRGKLLRDQGYAETIPATGEYHFTEDDVFVLITPYENAAAEERIWFATPNLRFRVSLIKTSSGTGVVTASFASEIRA